MGLLTILLLHVNVKDEDQPVLVYSQHSFIGHQYHKWKKKYNGSPHEKDQLLLQMNVKTYISLCWFIHSTHL